MTPRQLDIARKGAFIYERPDGTRYASFDYKPRDWGVPCVGRTGDHWPVDLNEPASIYLERCNDALAAGSRRAKTPQAVECEASHSGDANAAQRPNSPEEAA